MAYCNFQRKLLACASRLLHRSRGSQQIRLRGLDGRSFFGDCNFIRLPVQLGENVSFVDTVAIIDENPGYFRPLTRAATKVTCPFT